MNGSTRRPGDSIGDGLDALSVNGAVKGWAEAVSRMYTERLQQREMTN